MTALPFECLRALFRGLARCIEQAAFTEQLLEPVVLAVRRNLIALTDAARWFLRDFLSPDFHGVPLLS